MRRVLFTVLVLAFLSALGWADNVDLSHPYHVYVSGTWNSHDPSCASNCTETVTLNFVYYPNLLTYPYGAFFDSGTFQMTSSGFLGAFDGSPFTGSGFRPVYIGADDAWAFRNSSGDEIDLDHNGFIGPFPIRMYIYDCFSDACRSAFPGNPPSSAYIEATQLTATVTPVSDGDDHINWILIVASAFAIFAGGHKLSWNVRLSS